MMVFLPTISIIDWLPASSSLGNKNKHACSELLKITITQNEINIGYLLTHLPQVLHHHINARATLLGSFQNLSQSLFKTVPYNNPITTTKEQSLLVIVSR